MLPLIDLENCIIDLEPAFNNIDCSIQAIDPIILFQKVQNNQSYMNYYSTAFACNDSEISEILKPICFGLLPFCLYYTWIRVFMSIFSFFWLYRKIIKRNLSTNLVHYASVLPNAAENTRLYQINYYRKVVKNTCICEIVQAAILAIFFDGIQVYAINPSKHDPCNKTRLNSLCLYKNNGVMLVAGLLWLAVELYKVHLQIFAIATLTKVKDLRFQGIDFIDQQKKMSLIWTCVLGPIFAIIIIANYINGNLDTSTIYWLRIYLRFYSTATLGFWICVSLIYLLILTDKLVNYEDSFQDERTIINRDNFVFSDNQARLLRSRFEERLNNMDIIDNKEERIDTLLDDYRIRITNYLRNIERITNDRINALNSTSKSYMYVKYFLGFNFLNVIGYSLIIYSRNEGQFESYLYGFILTSLTNFLYDIMHVYILYKSYFNAFRTNE